MEDVRDVIVDALATEIAAGQLKTKMESAYADLSSEYTRYGGAVAVAKDEEKELPDPPKRLVDLEPVAEQYGLTLERGALLTQQQMLSESVVGKSRTVESGGRGAAYVYQLAFSKQLEMYEPVLTNDDPSRDWPSEWYLIVKVEDQPQTTPPLEEVRKDVVEAWRRQKAAKLALEKAQEFAQALDASTASFDDFFSTRNIETLTTDSFSRREFPSAPGQGEAPLLSSGFGLENVGAEFMDQAFELDEDKAAALLNFDHSTAYVIKLHTRERTDAELRQIFLAEANGWPGMRETLFVRFQTFNSTMYQQLWESIGREFDEDWLERQRNRE
ncbi:hypothetical protein OAS39_00300 [Pirellulales bacterium]|nr:hypothetical protein [Pirellulales bacterium]